MIGAILLKDNIMIIEKKGDCSIRILRPNEEGRPCKYLQGLRWRNGRGGGSNYICIYYITNR